MPGYFLVCFLLFQCSILGNNLKDLVDKYQHYEDASSGLLSGLQASEIAVNKQLSEPIAVDPKNLQRQLEETKVKGLKSRITFVLKGSTFLSENQDNNIIQVAAGQILALHVGMQL